jgi:hypothetical protein
MILLPFMAFVILPLYWVVTVSFKTTPQISERTSIFWPDPWTTEQYTSLISDTPFLTWFRSLNPASTEPRAEAKLRTSGVVPIRAVPTPAADEAERVEAAAPAAPEATPQSKRAPRGIAWWSAGLGLMGLAAAVAMYVRTSNAPEVRVTHVIVQSSATTQVPTTPDEAPEAKVETARAEAKPLRVEDLAPSAEAPSFEADPAARMARTGAVAQADTTKRGEHAAEGTENEPPAAKSVRDDGPSEPGMTAADSKAGMPDHPSSGAIAAAAGSVMGSARACVAGQSGASRATVVFGSGGRVQNVAISGPAAGTPAESCLKTALSQARVQPFAKPNFSVNLTVRPQ